MVHTLSFIVKQAWDYVPIPDREEEEEEPFKRQRLRRAKAMRPDERQDIAMLSPVASRQSRVARRRWRPIGPWRWAIHSLRFQPRPLDHWTIY